MTDKAVSALTSLTGANTATGDLVYIVDISEASASDRSKKITAQELQNYMKKFPATIGVGNATPAASGAGVSFPATASASSDANTLDDYEEGTWTPNYAGSTGSAGSYAASDNSGWYTKIGNMVTVWWRLILTDKGSWTGDIQITGLPFTVADPSGIFDGANAIGVGKVTFSGYVYTEPRRNTTYISLLNATSGSAVAVLATTTVSNDSAFLGQATYFV